MGGGTSTSNSATDALASISQSLFNITSPVTSGVTDTVMQGLRTGGIGMLMPSIAQAIQGMKSALSNTLSNSYYGSTLFGGARSPWLQGILQGTESQGNMAIGAAGPNMTMGWLSSMIPALFGQQGSAIGGMSGASASGSGMVSSANSAFGNMMSAALGGFAQGAGKAAATAAPSVLTSMATVAPAIMAA